MTGSRAFTFVSVVCVMTALSQVVAAQGGPPSIGSGQGFVGGGEESKVALAPTTYPCVGSLNGCSAHLVDVMGFVPGIMYDATMLLEALPHGIKSPVPMLARLCDTRVLRNASNRTGTPACVEESRKIAVMSRATNLSGSRPSWSSLSFTDRIYNGVDAALSQKRLSCYTIEWRSVEETGQPGAGRGTPSLDVRRESIPFELHKPRSGNAAGLASYGCY